jgi:NADH-quinone oxidoreductase subunit C
MQENNTPEIKINMGIIGSLLSGKGLSVEHLGEDACGVETVLVETGKIVQAAKLLKTNNDTLFDILLYVSGVDNKDAFQVIYYVYSTALNRKVVLKCNLDKNNPEIETLSGLYKTADWHEREAYDLFGIIFSGHPNLKRLLLPQDWKGHPMRKDYKQNDDRLIWNER